MADGGVRLAACGWRMADGGVRLAAGGLRLAAGGVRLAGCGQETGKSIDPASVIVVTQNE